MQEPLLSRELVGGDPRNAAAAVQHGDHQVSPGVIELGEARARSRQSDQERRGRRAELGDVRAQLARASLLAQVIGDRRERPAQRERRSARVR